MIRLNSRKELLILSIILMATTGLISGCVSREPPFSTPSIQEPDDPGSDIQFVLNDTYAAGETIEVKIKNRGWIIYTFNRFYEACYIAYTDSSGRQFIIPPGTHCDLIVSEDIKPGEIKTLFKWELDECVEDNWGCARSVPLPEGTYTLKGKFYSKFSIVSTVTEKSIDRKTTMNRRANNKLA